MKFIVWFFVVATSVVFAVLAMVGMPDPAGASGYGSIMAIPNIGVLLICGLIGWVCLHLWKDVKDVSKRVKVGTVLGYMLLLGFLSTFFGGFFELKIRFFGGMSG
jgi:hypothetical protein